MEGLSDHSFSRHGDQRARTICLKDCRHVRAKFSHAITPQQKADSIPMIPSGICVLLFHAPGDWIRHFLTLGTSG
jgi:hypothetical protein